MVSRNTALPSLGLRIGPACEAGLSAGMRRERVPPRIRKKERGVDTVQLLNCVVERHRVRAVDEGVASLDNNRRTRDRPLPQHIVHDRFRHLTVQVADVHSIHRPEYSLAAQL